MDRILHVLCPCLLPTYLAVSPPPLAPPFIRSSAGSVYDEHVGVNGWVRSEDAGLTTWQLYLRSLFWAVVTTTTVGYGDYTPSVRMEYFLSMLVMVVGQLLYAQLFAVMASLAFNASAGDKEYLSYARQTVVFCSSRRLPNTLTRRILNYLGLKWAHTRGLHENVIIESLPRKLGQDLKREMYEEVLQNSPLMQGAEPGLLQAMLQHFRLEFYMPHEKLVRSGAGNPMSVRPSLISRARRLRFSACALPATTFC